MPGDSIRDLPFYPLVTLGWSPFQPLKWNHPTSLNRPSVVARPTAHFFLFAPAPAPASGTGLKVRWASKGELTCIKSIDVYIVYIWMSTQK